MQIEFLSKFKTDVSKLSNKSVAIKLRIIILNFEKAETLSQISSIKKIRGHPHAFRMKIQNYRLGFYYENGIVEFARVLPRKDIYKYFP